MTGDGLCVTDVVEALCSGSRESREKERDTALRTTPRAVRDRRCIQMDAVAGRATRYSSVKPTHSSCSRRFPAWFSPSSEVERV